MTPSSLILTILAKKFKNVNITINPLDLSIITIWIVNLIREIMKLN